MTDAELVVISRLIDLCKAKRVRVLQNDGCRIELGEPEWPMPEAAKAAPPA